ncbi:MAG: C40 family peptidase [bacterium]
MNEIHQSDSTLESFGKWLIELSIALFFTYFILPSLAREYNYQFRLQEFLEQIQGVRTEFDRQLNQVSGEEWEKTAKRAGDRLAAVVNDLQRNKGKKGLSKSAKMSLSLKEKSLSPTPVSYLREIQNVQPEKVVNEGKRWLGVHYRWGGASKFYGTDCSGFSQSVFRTVGISLPRTAARQFQQGVYVPETQLRPGDLVFFSTYKPGPSHVGIYVGRRKFIHASSATGMVKIDSLNESYFKRRYLAGRRIIG